MPNTTSYGVLYQLLESLGFVADRSDPDRLVFIRPRTALRVYLPGEPDATPARAYHIGYVRKTLSENGVLEPERFDVFIENAARQPA